MRSPRALPLSAIADTFKDPRLNSLLQGHRRDKGVDIIPVVERRPPRDARNCVASRAVAIVIDRPVTRERAWK